MVDNEILWNGYAQYQLTAPIRITSLLPHCLFFLDLILTNEAFRREMSFVQFRNFVHEQQFYAWMYRSRFLYGRGIHGPDVDPSDSAVQNGDHQDNPSDDVDMDTS